MSAIRHDRVQASLTVALSRRRPTQREARLASGLVLFVYVVWHLVNHALGLISIDAAERGLALGVREFGGAARFTVVVHAGHAAVGDIGFPDAQRLMAAGA